MQYQMPTIFHSKLNQNTLICLNANGKDVYYLAANSLVDLHFTGDSQCLPLYRYDSAGNRQENITDWGLEQFRAHYADTSISKEAIFHYIYAVLHHPAYRSKYELNLKREFPRIPFYPDFFKWAGWGQALMDLHIHYETVQPFELQQIEVEAVEKQAKKTKPQEEIEETPASTISRTIALKVKLKADKTAGIIEIDEKTSLTGIPPEAWAYKLGNRSALEWVLDQYKEKKPSDPTIAEKFDTYRFADYKNHVIDLLKKVCTVSVETMRLLREMEITELY